jgi:hypothetical protein
MSTKKDVFKHAKGNFNRLTNSNYTSWSENMRRLLRATGGWNIVNGDEIAPDVPADNAEKHVIKKYENYHARFEDAAACIYNACSDPVRVHLKGIDEPEDMWNVLIEKMDKANTATGRQAIYHKFITMKPAPGAPIGEYFSDLTELRNQIAGTDEKISDTAFKTHIFNTMPAVFEMTVKFQQNLPNASVSDIMEALQEDERLRMMRNQTDAAADALASKAVTKKGKKYCDFCNTSTHNIDKCWSKNSKKNRRTQKNSNGKRDKSSEDEADDDDSGSDTCYYCTEPGHRAPQCPLKKKAVAMRQKKPRKSSADKDNQGALKLINTGS